MTTYYSIVEEITPEMLDWAREEAKTRAQEESRAATHAEVCEYRRQRSFRRRNAGFNRDMARRLMVAVAD